MPWKKVNQTNPDLKSSIFTLILNSGIDDKKANFGRFRNEIEKLTKKLQKVELDTAMWKDKFEDANEQVIKLKSTRNQWYIEWHCCRSGRWMSTRPASKKTSRQARRSWRQWRSSTGPWPRRGQNWWRIPNGWALWSQTRTVTIRICWYLRTHLINTFSRQ